MDESVSIFLVAALNAGLACIVAFGLFRLITRKGKASTAIDYGRKWSAWAVFTGTSTTLQKFFWKLDVNSFAVWLLVTITLGIVAFVAGWIYGKYFKQENGKSPEMKEERTGVNNVPPPNMISVSEKDPPLNPLTPKHDKTGTSQISTITQNTAQTTAVQMLPETELNEEGLYAQAWDEIHDKKGNNKALWAKAFSLSQGDEKRTQAKYIELRVTQLQELREQRRLEEEKVRISVEQEEKARLEMARRDERSNLAKEEQIRSLAKQTELAASMEDAEALIYKLGGTCQYSGLSGSVKSVYIYGEHHEFSSPYDFAQWVKNDIAPRVLSSNYYNHLCNTGTVKESDGE